jgi:hypothetical protein
VTQITNNALGTCETSAQEQKKMKRAATLKLITPLCLIGLLVGTRVWGQGAKVEMPKKVEQGSDITFQITTDKPANVAGNVNVQVASADGSQTFVSGGYVLRDRTATVGYTVPIDAKIGNWKVVKVSFSGTGGIRKDLTPSGDLIFEVKPHGTLVLPSQANVEIR